MRLTSVRTDEIAGRARLTGVVEHASGRAKEVWFDYPARWAPFIRADADVFLPTLLLTAMITKEDLATDLPVSQELALGMEEAQDVLVTWFPKRLKRAKLRFASVVRKPADAQGFVGAFFSAGIDSFFTALRSLSGQNVSTPRITHLIHIDGAEQPLSIITKGRAELMAEVAGELGLEIITGRTNIRDVYPYDYGLFLNGPVLASVGLSLSKGLSWALIPASSSYRWEDLVPWGSHVILDKLFSTEYLRIRQEGADRRREEKTALVAKSGVALKYLCCCTKNKGDLHNCGVCPKCIRTQIALQALGKLGDAATFKSPFDYSLIRRVDLYSRIERYYLASALEMAKAEAKDPRLVREIERHLSRHDRYRALVTLVKGTFVEPVARFVMRLRGKAGR